MCFSTFNAISGPISVGSAADSSRSRGAERRSAPLGRRLATRRTKEARACGGRHLPTGPAWHREDHDPARLVERRCAAAIPSGHCGAHRHGRAPPRLAARTPRPCCRDKPGVRRPGRRGGELRLPWPRARRAPTPGSHPSNCGLPPRPQRVRYVGAFPSSLRKSTPPGRPSRVGAYQNASNGGCQGVRTPEKPQIAGRWVLRCTRRSGPRCRRRSRGALSVATAATAGVPRPVPGSRRPSRRAPSTRRPPGRLAESPSSCRPSLRR